jgi:hypothetical protein
VIHGDGFRRLARGQSRRVAERWSPHLELTDAGGQCRLSLAGCASGRGATLQEAADDLVARVLLMAARVRAGAAWPSSTDLPPPDPLVLELLDEIGDVASRGGDVRARLFGGTPA